MSLILRQRAAPSLPVLVRASAGTTAALLTLAIAACGSSSSSQSSSAAILGSTVQQDCTAIADVLSDGPDPDSDAIGYAQAQILPLRQLTIGDAPLHSAVLALASAYQAFSSGDTAGSKTAALKVAKTESAVNAICPQAAP